MIKESYILISNYIFVLCLNLIANRNWTTVPTFIIAAATSAAKHKHKRDPKNGNVERLWKQKRSPHTAHDSDEDVTKRQQQQQQQQHSTHCCRVFDCVRYCCCCCCRRRWKCCCLLPLILSAICHAKIYCRS